MIQKKKLIWTSPATCNDIRTGIFTEGAVLRGGLWNRLLGGVMVVTWAVLHLFAVFSRIPLSMRFFALQYVILVISTCSDKQIFE
jgi:hypothetical protein